MSIFFCADKIFKDMTYTECVGENRMKNFSSSITKTVAICSAILIVLGFSCIPAYSASTTRTEAEVKFVVYPDGTVEVSGNGNSTGEYTYPRSIPSLGLKAQFSKIVDKYNAIFNATFTLPPEQKAEFPYNATGARVSAQYADNITSVTLDVSLTLCDSFGGMDFNSFPFNSTDLSVVGNYTDQKFNGTIIIHLVPGLAIGNIKMNFEGNLTRVKIDDSIRVFYNYTLPILGFPKLNEAMLNNFLAMLNTTIPGTGEKSLYKMTDGMLTCTTFNTTLTPIDENSADITFLVIIEGDFIQFFVNFFTRGGLGVPIPMPDSYASNSNMVDENVSGVPIPMLDPYPFINATLYSIKRFDFSVAYSKSTKTVVAHSNFSQNLTEYMNVTTKYLLEMYPPKLRPYVELLLNTTYASVQSSTETITYSNGQVKYNGNYTLSGDLNAQVNHVKNVYIDLMNATAPGPAWLIDTLKNTYVDITNLKLDMNINSTFQQWSFEGVKFAPPIDSINATSFRLESFFNITSNMLGGRRRAEPPLANDTLKLVVQGGSNGTHTVTLHIDSEVPKPDEFLSGNIMVWHNQSISKLKRLIFNIWEGKTEAVYDPTSITPNNPYIIDARQEANCMLIISNISQQATIQVKNVSPPNVPPPGTYRLLGTCIQISLSESVTVNATIRIYYTLEQLAALGLDEDRLKIFYFNATSNQWTEVQTQVNKTEHYAEAIISHFSLWALFGQSPTPLWQEWWFLVTVGIITVIIIACALTLRKKKHKT